MPSRGTLGRLLAALAAADPEAPFVEDAPGREAVIGRVPARWSRNAALQAVDRLAARLRRLRLDARAPVAIHLGNGPEACLALLAVEAAGLTPCLAPASFDVAELDSLFAMAGVRAVVTQTRLGALRPAETIREVAARRFQIRFVLAFGPDVPPGMIDLDQAMASEAEPGEPHPPSGGLIVTCESRPDGSQAIWWPDRGLLAAALAPIRAMRPSPGDVVLNLLAQDDLKGLATGLLACLLTGATLRLAVGLEALRIADQAGPPTHVVLPAWAASGAWTASGAWAASGPGTAPADPPQRLRMVVAVEDAASPDSAGGYRPKAGPLPIVTILSLGESALLVAGSPPGTTPPTAAELVTRQAADPAEFLAMRIAADGGIVIRGAAAGGSRSGSGDKFTTAEWRRSRYRLTDDGRILPSS